MPDLFFNYGSYPITRALNILPGRVYLDLAGNLIFITYSFKQEMFSKTVLRESEQLLDLDFTQFSLFLKLTNNQLNKVMYG